MSLFLDIPVNSLVIVMELDEVKYGWMMSPATELNEVLTNVRIVPGVRITVTVGNLFQLNAVSFVSVFQEAHSPVIKKTRIRPSLVFCCNWS